MKYSRWCFCLALCAALLLGGCALQGQTPSSSASVAMPQEANTWPENDFTSQIPKPQAGQVTSIIDDSANGRCTVSLDDVTRDEVDTYLSTLQEQGFVKVEQGENDVSGGVLLQKDNTTLSIAYSGDSFGILIICQ